MNCTRVPSKIPLKFFRDFLQSCSGLASESFPPVLPDWRNSFRNSSKFSTRIFSDFPREIPFEFHYKFFRSFFSFSGAPASGISQLFFRKSLRSSTENPFGAPPWMPLGFLRELLWSLQCTSLEFLREFLRSSTGNSSEVFSGILPEFIPEFHRSFSRNVISVL